MKKLSMISIPLILVMLLSAGCTTATKEMSSPTPETSAIAPSPAPESPVTSPSPSSQEPLVAASPPTQKATLTSDLSPGTGMVEFYVTDPPPPDVDEVWVEFETLEVHKTGGNWTSIDVADAGPFPLIYLADNGIEEFLGSQIVEVGKYTQIRLGFASVEIEANGENQTARVPSGKIKLVGNFNVTENNNTAITLDFNGEKSVIQTGKGEYIFKPVIKLDVSDKGKPPSAESGADLQISKSDSSDPVLTGDNITYTLEVENLGPDDATGVTVTDNLTSAQVTYLGPQSFNTDNGTASYDGEVFTWDIGDLAVGATANLTIEVQAPLSSGDITNTASVFGNEDDPDTGNNDADEDTEVDVNGE